MRQAQENAADKRSQGTPRLLEPNSQVELRASDLESLLAEDHRTRRIAKLISEKLGDDAADPPLDRGKRQTTQMAVFFAPKN